MQEYGVLEINVADAKQMLISCGSTGVKMVMQYDSWPPKLFYENPKALLVDQDGNLFWIRRCFPLQLLLLSTNARRAGVTVENTCELSIAKTGQAKYAG